MRQNFIDSLYYSSLGTLRGMKDKKNGIFYGQKSRQKIGTDKAKKR
jgi:hypothetical protein